MQICCHAEVSTVFLMLVEPNPSDVLAISFKPACRAKEVRGKTPCFTNCMFVEARSYVDLN